MRIGMSRLPAFFITLYVGFLVIIVVLALVAWLGGSARASGHPGDLMLALGMAGGGLGFMALGRRLSRNEGSFLLQFLEDTLEADEA